METVNNDKKSFKELATKYLYDTLRLWRGCVIGFAAGYIISYFFQEAGVRAKLGFWGYITHFYGVLSAFGYNDRGLTQMALTAWIFVLIGISIGCSAEKRLIEKGKIKAWTRKNRD